MANVGSAPTAHGKKSVDQEIPLIPFIDLLFCCVMFLLATAVWNQLGALPSAGSGGRTATPPTEVAPPALVVTLRVSAAGFHVAATDGTAFEIPRAGDHYDARGLREKLEALRGVVPANALFIAPDDGVAYESVVTALDTALGAGFRDVSVAPES